MNADFVGWVEQSETQQKNGYLLRHFVGFHFI